MSVLVTGGIELNGTERVEIPVPAITGDSKILLKSVSTAMKGIVVVSEITPGVGFGLSSTSADDVGMTVYFDVLSPE